MNGEAMLIFLIPEIVLFRKQYYKVKYREILEQNENMIHAMLMLSHFSRVGLCVTPETAAHQAPPSLGFSRKEHWSRLPFPSPMHESVK